MLGPGRMIGLAGMTLPAGDAVARAGQADLGVVLVAEADVEHEVPVAGRMTWQAVTLCFSHGLPGRRRRSGLSACLVQSSPSGLVA